MAHNGEVAFVKAWSPLEWAGFSTGGRYLGDTERETDAVLAAALLIYYAVTVIAFGLKSTKQKAWVLTTCSASTCTALFFVNVYLGDITQLPVPVEILRDTPFSRFLSRYFRLTLLMDLGLGVVFYRDQLNLLTSWIHHIAYFILMNFCIGHRVTLAFVIFLVEELPTFLLGLGSINKDLRSDYGFGFSFFTLRILYHAIHLYTVLFLWPRDTDGVVDVVRGNVILTMVLHMYWFWGWVRQQMRKWKKAKSS